MKLASIDIETWGDLPEYARKLDRRETKEVVYRNGASERAVRVNKSLLPGAESLEAVTKKATEIRTWFYERTLPWSGSARILRSDAYWSFVQELNNHKAAYERRVDEFVAEYPALVAHAQADLNGLYNPDDYPPEDVIRDKFRVNIRFLPVPAAGDWRVSLSDELMAELKESVERDVREATAVAMKEAWSRLHACVKHALERLSNPEAIFRDSLVENAEELCRTSRFLYIFAEHISDPPTCATASPLSRTAFRSPDGHNWPDGAMVSQQWYSTGSSPRRRSNGPFSKLACNRCSISSRWSSARRYAGSRSLRVPSDPAPVSPDT